MDTEWIRVQESGQLQSSPDTMAFTQTLLVSVCPGMKANQIFNGNTTLAFTNQIRHASKKAGGSTKNNRDSAGRRLGAKKVGGRVNKD